MWASSTWPDAFPLGAREADSCGVRGASLPSSPAKTLSLKPRASGTSCPPQPLWSCFCGSSSPAPNPRLSRLSSPCPCPTVRSGSRTLHYLLSAPWEEDEIRRDRVEPQSVSLSWREPIPAGAPGANGTEYEIRYYEKVSRGLGGTWGCIPGCDLAPSPAGFLFFISTSQQKSFLLSF